MHNRLFLFLNLVFAIAGATLEQLFAHQAAKEHFHSQSQQRKLIRRASLGGEPDPQDGTQVSSPDGFGQHAACRTACSLQDSMQESLAGPAGAQASAAAAQVLAGPLGGNACQQKQQHPH